LLYLCHLPYNAGALSPNSGAVNSSIGATVSLAKQAMPKDYLKLSIREYFLKCLHDNDSGLENRIHNVLKMIKLSAPLDRKVGTFSGGQMSKLLLAGALILNPNILILG
jgi:ATPase subunit of ABC transporter with duplicated ATPase domains